MITLTSKATPNRPDMGTQPSQTEKMSISTKPSQKTGMLTPMSEPSMDR